MRDNARRLLTILTVILALWLVLGFWPLSIGNQVIFSLCILLAGGAALWRQRRRAVSRQRSEIVLPPEDFQGAVVLVCGDTDGLFPGRSAHGETRHGWYLRGDSAEQLPRLAQYLAAARPALVSQVSVLLAVVPEHHPSGEHLAQSLRDWRRSIVQCRTWLNGLPPVWSVFWVTPPGGQAVEAAGLPSRRRGLVSRRSRRDKRPSRLPGGSGRAALPHACIRRCGWRAFCPWPKTLCSGHSAPGRRNFLR